jgi:hypothetical protein
MPRRAPLKNRNLVAQDEFIAGNCSDRAARLSARRHARVHKFLQKTERVENPALWMKRKSRPDGFGFYSICSGASYLTPSRNAKVWPRRNKESVMFFTSSPKMTLDCILSADLHSQGIKVIRGNGPEPSLYLCDGEAVLFLQLDAAGHCSFDVPEYSPMPFRIFDALAHMLDCKFNRLCQMASPSASPEDQRDAITAMLGASELSDTDQVLQYACGKPHEIEPHTPLWRKAEIARVFVERNAELREVQNSSLLLLLVEHAYDRQDPPFKFAVRKRHPAGAKLLGEMLLGWAEEWTKAAEKAPA